MPPTTRDFLKRIATLPNTNEVYTLETALKFHVYEFKQQHPNFQLPIFHKYLLVRFYLTVGYHSSFFNFLKKIILQSPAGSYQCHTDYIPLEFNSFKILIYPRIEEDYKLFYDHFINNYNFKLYSFISINYDDMKYYQFLDETFCESKGNQQCPIPRQDGNQKYIYPYDSLGNLLYHDPELTESDSDDEEITMITNSPCDSPDVTSTTDEDVIVHSPCIINNVDDLKKKPKRKRDGLCPRDAKFCKRYEKWAGEFGQPSGRGVNSYGNRVTRYGRESRRVWNHDW